MKVNAQPNDKVILLGGSVFKASKFLDRRVYMDINGLYDRMQVHALPSVVAQEGLKLKVSEVAL